MSFLFSKPKRAPPPPPVPPPAPLPEVGPETEDLAARIARRRAGWRRAAFITGPLEPVSSGGKKLLGG